MAQLKVTNAAAQGFAVGTTLAAYPVANWPAAQPPTPVSAPKGASSGSAAVQSDGSCTITGLAAGTSYWITDSGVGTKYLLMTTPGTGSDPAAVVEVSQVDTAIDVLDRAARLLGAVNQSQVGGNNIDTNSGAKSAGTQRVVVATDQPALTNPLDQNLKQLGGVALDTNSGAKSAGTQRVVLATDQPALTTPMPVDSELAAAVAASDSLANVTAPQVLAHGMVWDGFNTQWKRMATPTGGGDGLTGGGFISAGRYLWNGASWDRVRDAIKFVTFTSASITAGTGVTLLTPTSGKKFRLMGWCFSSSVAAQLIFGDNAVGTVIVKSETTAAAGVSKVERLGNGFLSAAANNVLKLDVSATSTVAGFAMYIEE